MSYRARVASVYLLGFFIDLINMFIANVAYPDIGRHFNAPIGQLAWVSNGYLLGLTLVIPLSGWLAGRIGSKRLFMLSLGVFLVGSAGVGCASSMAQLIGWRWLQGMGGGLLIPLGQTMTYLLYRRNERAKLSSMVMVVALLAPALSPVVGGLLVDSVGWRWVFLASLPLAVAALILAGCWLKPDVQAASEKPLDFAGLVCACSALALILTGLTQIGEAGHLRQGALLLLAGLLLLACYIRGALRKTRPLLNLRLLQDPLLRTAMLVYQLIPGIFTGISLIAMLYLQNQLGMPAALVGAMMLPWSLAAFAAISLSGKTFNLLGPRPLFISGCLAQGAGMGLLALSGHGDATIITIAAFALMGFGGSLCSSTAQSCAFIQIPDNELADASALWNINRQLSFCFGVTLAGLLLNALINADVPLDQAYRLCFIVAGSSVAIPVLICLGMANRDLIHTLTQEKQ